MQSAGLLCSIGRWNFIFLASLARAVTTDAVSSYIQILPWIQPQFILKSPKWSRLFWRLTLKGLFSGNSPSLLFFYAASLFVLCQWLSKPAVLRDVNVFQAKAVQWFQHANYWPSAPETGITNTEISQISTVELSEVHLLKLIAQVFYFEVHTYTWMTTELSVRSSGGVCRSQVHLHNHLNKQRVMAEEGGRAARRSTPGRVKAAGVCHNGGLFAVNQPMKGLVRWGKEGHLPPEWTCSVGLTRRVHEKVHEAYLSPSNKFD